MQDRPTAIELLEAAAQFIERDVVPTMSGAKQFQARVAANVMRIVAREIQLEEPMVRDAVAALIALLGAQVSPPADLAELRQKAAILHAELSERIRAGAADAGPWRDQVFEVVRKLVEDKLRIANPRYLDADRAARASR